MPAPDLWLFFLLVLGVIVLPGMDMAYVAGSALVGGLRAGAAAVAGIVAGGLVHVAVATTGIAALLSLWPAAFDAVLGAGAIYMAWIGWTLLRSAPGDAASSDATKPPASRLAIFRRAVLTCLANPKAYMFSLAVFPAFVQPAGRPLVLQFATLAAIVTSTQAAVYGAVAVLAAGTGRLAGGASAQRWMPRVVGPMLIAGAGLTLALGWQPAHAQSSVPAAPVVPVSPAPVEAPADPARAFDFLMGDWRIQNRKRLGILKNEDRWETFEASSRVRPLPGGIGNRDDFTAPAWRPGYLGATIRLYNPPTKTWALYWVSNTGAGLDPKTGELLAPVVGGWHGDTGLFEGDDTWEGRPIRVRYTWRRVDADHATWAQAFSPDAGRTWETNWEMTLTRRGPAEDLVALEQSLARAFREADVASLERDLAEGFTLVNGRGEVDTKASTIDELRRGVVRYTRFEMRDMAVRVVGHDMAVVTGIASLAGHAGERAFAADVRFTDTFVRDAAGDGRWRLVAGQASSPLAR